MQKINLKIHEYNENSNSIIVSFSSDTSKKSIDDYTKYAIPVNLSNTTDINKLIELTALSGIQIAEQQNFSESGQINTQLISDLKEAVGKELEFSIEGLKAKFKPE